MTLHNSIAPSQADRTSAHGEHVPISSRGLGWSGLNFERRDSLRGWRDQPEGSRHHLIFLALSNGRVLRESNGQRIEHQLTPGRVLILPSRTSVRWRWHSRIGYSVLLLEPDVLDAVAQEAFGLSPDQYRLPVSERRNDTTIANIAGVLARETLSRDRAGMLYSDSLARILSVHLLRNYATTIDGEALASRLPEEQRASATPIAAVQSRAVADALRFIQQNYAREVGLGDIAAAAHVSPFHLTRLFKQTLGVSPYQHVIQVRVNSARHLLSAGSGRRSLAEIASAVGFSDQSHLTRHFKRLTGVTPSRFAAGRLTAIDSTVVTQTSQSSRRAHGSRERNRPSK
jgi:AraC family transcriptional regulator